MCINVILVENKLSKCTRVLLLGLEGYDLIRAFYTFHEVPWPSPGSPSPTAFNDSGVDGSKVYLKTSANAEKKSLTLPAFESSNTRPNNQHHHLVDTKIQICIFYWNIKLTREMIATGNFGTVQICWNWSEKGAKCLTLKAVLIFFLWASLWRIEIRARQMEAPLTKCNRLSADQKFPLWKILIPIYVRQT